jgi:glutamate dehydrogenase/leucine dehydrogenase
MLPLVSVFEQLGGEFEEVVFLHDPPTGLRAIVAVHSTVLGPALGGTRCYPFASDDDALADVLRLSRAMTYKAAAAGLDLGGGKAVIIGDPRTVKTEALLRAYGRFIEDLGGRYITAEDVGTTLADIDLIRRETRHAGGASRSLGGSGDPSILTAYGLFAGMRAAALEAWGDVSLAGRRVAIQGVGKVGSGLARHLLDAGASAVVADVDANAAARLAEEIGVDVVDPDAILSTECDVLSPCALGGALNDRSIPELRCGVVCGAANNQLERPEHAAAIAARGIVYAPDYVVNAGGIINISEEFVPGGYDPERARRSVARIEDTLTRVFRVGREQNLTAATAADRMAEERIRAGRGQRLEAAAQ